MTKKKGNLFAVHSDGVMRPAHPRWNEFLQRLGGPEGCNFGETESEGITWRCNGGRDKSFAIAIMKEMGDVDVEQSLDFFERNGGYCDCEIAFNVEHDVTFERR